MNLLDGWRRHWMLWTVTVALLLLSTGYLTRGFDFLLFQHRYDAAVDLHMRWVEQRYVYNGQNPYDVVELVAAHRNNQPPPECSRDNRVDPSIGPPYFRQGGYPSWSFFTAALFVLPTEFTFARTYFAALNALALAIIFVWAYCIGRFHSRAGGVLLGAAALAVFGNFRTLQVGQYGILVNAMLIAVYFVVERHKRALAGIIYGMAAMKPQIAGVFAISFLVRRQWASAVAAAAYLVLASLGIWALTKTNPIEMLAQMHVLVHSWMDNPFVSVQNPDSTQHSQLAEGCSSFLWLLLELGVDWNIATPLAAGLGLISAAVLMWLWRSCGTLTLFAIAATIGRLWTYHLPYDDVMMLFLLAALGKQLLAKPSLSTGLIFGLVGLSLWIPIPTWPRLAPPGVQITQMAVWLFGLAFLLALERRSCPLEDEPDFADASTQSRRAPGQVCNSDSYAVG